MASIVEGRVSGAAARDLRCVVCGFRLEFDRDADDERQTCGDCTKRPEGKLVAPRAAEGSAPRSAGCAPVKPRAVSARAFTDAEKSLIKRVHGYMPAAQLLDLLNERLISDLGPDAARYTMDHLHQEIGSGASGPVGTKDWGGLRRLMSQARRSGVLGRVSEQVIDDFAVVFQLNARQVMSLKDIVLAEQGE